MEQGKTVLVDGLNWTCSEVAKSASVDEFVALHMKDAGTYRKHKPERKEAALKAVYSLCVPATAAEPTVQVIEEEKPKKPTKQRKPSDDEQAETE